MKKIITLVILFSIYFTGNLNAEVRSKDYDYLKPDIGIKKGMTPKKVNQILGQPQIEWVRGYFYRSERFFYWRIHDKWFYVAFWDYSGAMVVGDFASCDEPKLINTTKIDNSTSGPHIFVKAQIPWIPFKENFPLEYTRQITYEDTQFMEQYFPNLKELYG